jgi:3-dehydroquinate dehydratase-1
MSVHFGPLELKAGKPAVAVSFTDADGAEDVAAAKAAGVAIAELRIDLFGDVSAANVVETARRLGGLPLLATIRMSEEGGRWTGGEAARRALFEAVLPHVDAVDIELRATDALTALAPKIAAAGKALVVSHHDFSATPGPDALADIARRALAAGADIVKVAATIVEEDDLNTLAGFLTSRPAPNLVVIGMGERGLVTRMLFPALGSLFTFAGKGERASAPGQISYERMLSLLSTLYPA